ncbi:hypothetical protein PVAP13_1KG403000 [Panicum virgatum]|uniref:Uncharacterized protein n=1 Tax=Panicum virgatum TaxID=38727 RepID=A0A8T0XEN9_PANVG|nr:hypothetical protein PVAP13_1KG403000 [Panicum virgatum]
MCRARSTPSSRCSVPNRRPPTSRWSWDTVEPPPPFMSSVVSSYAVHPDGRTVFVSVWNWRPDIPGRIYGQESRRSTFTFDMERLEWAHAGEWILPFKGRAHYDRELDAWVGLCLYREGDKRVCCCDVPPAARPCPPGSSAGTCSSALRGAPSSIWAPRSCTWAIAHSAWSREGFPRIAPGTAGTLAWCS